MRCVAAKGESPGSPFLPEIVDSSTADLEHSTAFRKAAEDAWRATHNGAAPYEAGFSIEKDKRPGSIQLSILATVNAKTHLSIHSSPTALGTLHVHTKYGEPAPSPGDIQSAKALHKMVYAESRTPDYIASAQTEMCATCSTIRIGSTKDNGSWAKPDIYLPQAPVNGVTFQVRTGTNHRA